VRFLLAVGFLVVLSSVCQAQNPSANCSYGYWTLTGAPYNQAACADPPVNNITETDYYHEECRALSGNSAGYAPASDYQTMDSQVTGSGQNWCSGFPSYLTATCKPYMHFYETDGGYSGTDNYANRFYNDAYDMIVAHTASSNQCGQSGGFHEDFKQCTTLTCSSGCPNPTTGPPYCGAGNSAVWNTSSCSWVCVPTGQSPVVVDVSGNGFQLTSAANGVKFDMAGTGPVQMGWTAPGAMNAFLCLPDAGGGCDNGKNLFGNFTPQPRSSTPNGFLALAVYDSNGDGVIDSRDAIFPSLRLWIDTNHDGISQPNELYTLPALGVQSISLNYKLDERQDQYGNRFRYRAQVSSTSGAHFAYDVFFVTQTNSASTKQSSCPVPKGTLLPASKTGGFR